VVFGQVADALADVGPAGGPAEEVRTALGLPHDAEEDFRMRAFRKALGALLDSNGPDRMRAVQMLLSDPRTELLPELDRKSAYGAYEAR